MFVIQSESVNGFSFDIPPNVQCFDGESCLHDMLPIIQATTPAMVIVTVYPFEIGPRDRRIFEGGRAVNRKNGNGEQNPSRRLEYPVDLPQCFDILWDVLHHVPDDRQIIGFVLDFQFVEIAHHIDVLDGRVDVQTVVDQWIGLSADVRVFGIIGSHMEHRATRKVEVEMPQGIWYKPGPGHRPASRTLGMLEETLALPSAYPAVYLIALIDKTPVIVDGEPAGSPDEVVKD